MRELIKDTQVSKCAEEWMQHLHRSFGFKDSKYWSDIVRRFEALRD